ncbi:MAG: VWA domain-containing protein [Gammaproteobacteria bacterium]|nr:MAG: VWA domain-containing protein [Gammaproteobacteria bacterium]
MARRRFNVFSLSFLDVMSCGLGAVVLFFMVINAQITARANRASEALLAQTDRLEEQVLNGRKNLVRLRNALESERERQMRADDEAQRLAEMLRVLETELAELDKRTIASEESVEDLQADIQRLEAARRRLAARAAEPTPDTGERIRRFVGDGNRQYLTGMQMGGRRVLILVDASASMLGRTYVNVLRFRNLPPERKLRAPKWRQTLRTVDWLTTRLTPGSRFQLYWFNEQAHSVIDGSDGQWLETGDGAEVNRAIAALYGVEPRGGSSLYKAFDAARKLDPPPDNIYLLTDGLPTQGKVPPPTVRKVRADRRADLFREAVKLLPRRAPVNILLYPMDGDPTAAGLFWDLAIRTGGSLITPARDWP